MRVRPYRRDDADLLASIFYDSVPHPGRAAYSQAQVGAWAHDLATGEGIHRRGADGRAVLVAEADDGQLLGYADLQKDGHIDRFFRRPDLQHRGVASELLDALVDEARWQNLRRLTVEASQLAKPVFVRAGFQVLGRREYALRGAAIHTFALERRLRA